MKEFVWIIWFLKCILAVSVLTSGCGTQARAQAPVITIADGWATFGQVFPQGTMREPIQVGILPTQTDVKCRWADGSIKFAVVTVATPKGGAYPVQSRAADFAANVPSIVAKFTIAGQVWTAELPNTETADNWLKGPLVREYRVRLSPSNAGQQHPLLSCLFDMRLYQDGTSRLDITVENCLNQTAGNSVVYDVEILNGSTSLFKRTNVTHWWLTRWRQTFALNGLQAAEAKLDFEPFYRAKALPRYLGSIKSITYPCDGQAFDILQGGSIRAYMGDVGGREELAPYPDWTARALVWGDPAQFAYVKKHGDLAASWPVHIQELDGSPITIDKRPGFWLDPRGDVGNKPLGNMAATGPLKPEVNHVPSLAFVPYLITGDRFYADETGYWANWVLLWSYQNSGQCGRCSNLGLTSYSQFKPGCGSEGILRSNQVRGMAWGLRNLADAAAYLPDADPLKNYLAAKVANNLKYLDGYADLYASPLGAMFCDKRPENQSKPPYVYIAPWELDYLTWAIDRANGHGFPGGERFAKKHVGLIYSLFTSTDYPRAYAAPYLLIVGERTAAGVVYYSDLKKVWSVTFGNGSVKPAQFPGYYGPESRLMLGQAVKQGLRGAQEAFDWVSKIELEQPFNQDGTSDLNRRAGWAIDFSK